MRKLFLIQHSWNKRMMYFRFVHIMHKYNIDFHTITIFKCFTTPTWCMLKQPQQQQGERKWNAWWSLCLHNVHCAKFSVQHSDAFSIGRIPSYYWFICCIFLIDILSMNSLFNDPEYDRDQGVRRCIKHGIGLSPLIFIDSWMHLKLQCVVLNGI